MGLLDILAQEQEALFNVISDCQQILKHLPKGKLYIEHSDNHIYYHKYIDGQVKYTPSKDIETIQLKERLLVEEILENAKSNLKLIDSFMQNYKVWDPNLLVESRDYFDDIPKILINNLGFPDYREYTSKPDSTFYTESLTKVNTDGQHQRSISELAISNLYIQKKIKYEYEKLVVLPDGFEFAPDYTVWSPTLQKYLYHEHLGMLSDEDYYATNEHKFHELIQNGIFPFVDILFTFNDKDGNLNLYIISKLIDLFMR